MAVLGGEAADQVQNLAWFRDGLADVAEGVGELLEPGGVLADRHVSLVEAAELRLKVDRTVELVVAEHVVDALPDLVRGGVGGASEVEDIPGHGVVQPADDALVDHHPLLIAALSAGRRHGDVCGEAELVDDGVEEAPPFRVVGLGDVEDHRNMGADVHRLQRACGERRR